MIGRHSNDGLYVCSRCGETFLAQFSLGIITELAKRVLALVA